jgi:hypothetical protein
MRRLCRADRYEVARAGCTAARSSAKRRPPDRRPANPVDRAIELVEIASEYGRAPPTWEERCATVNLPLRSHLVRFMKKMHHYRAFILACLSTLE